jgi:hypothetical protein
MTRMWPFLIPWSWASCALDLPALVIDAACRTASCGGDLWIHERDGCEAWFDEHGLSCAGSPEAQRACVRELQLAMCTEETPWPAVCEEACDLGAVQQLDTGFECDRAQTITYPPSRWARVCIDPALERCSLGTEADPCPGLGLLVLDLEERWVHAEEGVAITVLQHPGLGPVQQLPLDGGHLDLVLSIAADQHLAWYALSFRDTEGGFAVDGWLVMK